MINPYHRTGSGGEWDNTQRQRGKQWILKLSTPAAAVSLGVGFLMKKFSFGDEEKMRISKKIIRGTLTSYGLILATDLILAAIKSFI